MRRVTARMKVWFRRRAISQAKKKNVRTDSNRIKDIGHEVTLWTGNGVVQARSKKDAIAPPEILCFRTNTEETLEFLVRFRGRSTARFTGIGSRQGGWVHYPKRGMPTLDGYADYAKIKYLSTAAAVVIAADYDRLAQLLGSAPPTINLDEWSDALFMKLFEIGFFEIVGLTAKVEDRYSDNDTSRTMRILSGTNAAGLESAATALLELSSHFLQNRVLSEEVISALNSALSEAMSNVAKHAYPGDHVFALKHVSKWWVTAEVDRSNGTLTVVIYDQGASIPVTFPKRPLTQKVQDYFSRTLKGAKRFENENDGTYVAAAMIPGNTQTGLSFRGYGIPQMKALVDICKGGRLTIFSRGGCCEYEYGRDVSSKSYPQSIGGTLVEWVVQLPEQENV